MKLRSNEQIFSKEVYSWTRYGTPDGLQLREVEKPAPKDDEVLVKIHATRVTAGDCELRSLKMPPMLGFPMRIYAGFRKPERITIIGQEMARENSPLN